MTDREMTEEQLEEFVEAEYEGRKAIAIQEMIEEEKERQLPIENAKTMVVAHEESDIPTVRPYKLPKGVLFLYEGKVGEMFVILGCNKVVRIESVGWGTVNVFSPATGTTAGIAPTTEVIPFDPAKHAELVKKIPKVKVEKENEG